MILTAQRLVSAAALGVALLPMISLALADEVEPEEVVVALHASDVRGASLPAGHFRLRSLEVEEREELRVETDSESSALRASASLPAASRWRVCLDVPGRWAPCENLTVGQPEPTHLRAWPSVTVAGRFEKPPEDVVLPERMILRFSAVRPPQREGFQEVNIGCSLKELAFSCEVPALELDLALRLRGFVPVYRFGADLPPSGKWDFGMVKLERGASLVARVETADGESLGEEVKARLVPFAPGQTGMHLRDRLRRPVAEAEVAGNGFVQLAAIPAGVYSLEVSAPGYAPAFESPLEVWEDKEVRLVEPVILERPLTLEVVVTPPLDWLDRPWHLQMMRASRLTGTYDERPLFDGVLEDSGRVRLPDQAVGMYVVQIFDSLGNPLSYARDYEVTGPADSEIVVDLDLMIVRGTLTYEDEPVSGSLWFGMRHGALHSEMAADLEGTFSGVLPNPGWWTVEIDVPSLDLTRYWARVKVTPDSRGEAEVEIALPDTEVTGRVVDGEGRAVPGAEVNVWTTQWVRRTEADSDGNFRFMIVEPGRAGIGAIDESNGTERTSDVQEIRIADDQATPPVELVLQERKVFRGRVISERGPVPGALLRIATVDPPAAAASQDTRADAEGRFKAKLRANSRRLQAVVGPPGHSLRAFDLAAAEPLELVVPSAGGAITLRLADTPDPYAQSALGPSWVLYQDGIGLPTLFLHQWARGHGLSWKVESGTMEIPQLAPGHYRLCSISVSGMLSWEQPDPISCDEGFLSAGGQLELELPAARR